MVIILLEKSNNSDLVALGVNDKYIFFYQRWQELLHTQTRDIHQYKIHNAFTAIAELISVIDLRLDGLHNTDHNIKICLAELNQLFDEDCVLQKYYFIIFTHLIKKIKKLSSKDKYSLADKIDLKNSLEYNLFELQKDFFNKISTELEIAINVSDNVLVEKLSYILISQCIYMGWSPQELCNIVRVLRGYKTEDEKWREFLAILTSNTEHDVLLSISLKPGASWITELDVLASIGIPIFGQEQLIDFYRGKCDLSRSLNAEKKYTKVSINAADVISAAHLGIKSISEKMDLASFYNIIKPWDIDAVHIIVINKSNWFVRPLSGEKIYQTYDYIDSSNNIFENTKNIFSDNSKNEIKRKLATTFTYTNISRASFFQEEKFLNMWVALEALSQSNLYDSIITSVKETVSASMCLRYYYRFIRNFYEDCNRCKITFEFTSSAYDFSSYSGSQIAVKMLEILKNSVLSSELRSKCSINSLLLYRFDEVSQMVNDTPTIHKKIVRHNERIKWQLQRLYRIRNEIAHSAFQTESSLVIFIEHLYDYLACFITEIVMCKNMDDLNHMEQIFSVINDNFSYYISEGKNATNDKIIEFYNTGIMNFLP